MDTHQPPKPPPTEPASPDRTTARADAFAEILAHARKSPSASRFLGNVLRTIARSFASPYAALHVRYASNVVQDDCHTGATDPNFWKGSLQAFLTEALAEPRSHAKLLRAKTGDTKVAFLATPIFDASGPAIGALALVVTPVEADELTYRLTALEALTRLASFAVEFLGAGRPQDSLTGPNTGSPPTAAPSAALARAASFSGPEELAFAVTNDLCNKLGCEQVALGAVNRNRVKVLSVSGLDTVHRQSPGIASLRAAMEECADADTPIVCQPHGDWTVDDTEVTYRLHKQWHAAVQGDAVASIPLQIDSRPAAILSLRRRPDHPFEPKHIEDIRARVEPFAQALVLAQRAGRGLVRHATDSTRETLGVLTSPGRFGVKVLAFVATLAAVSFIFGSANYELTVPCVVTPDRIRHVAAPFDAVLETALVLEGDRVQRGDILCTLDHRDLDQQKAELLAERAVLERTQDRARADDAPVEVQLALANQHLVQTKLEIVNRRIEQCTLRAPIDGVVVAGDLRKRIGAVVARGDPLFAVAPLERWKLELEVPESASADLATGLSGFFASYARPEQAREFTITRVLADAQIRDSRNVYVAEADIDALADWMRPGMEGVAKVRLGSRRIWWITLHRAIDYLRLNLWL